MGDDVNRSLRDEERLQDEERRMRRVAVTAATRRPPETPGATGPAQGTAPSEAAEETEDDSRSGQRHEQHALWLDAQIRDAMARGEFDNLPGAGKPIPGLDKPYDPDWWVKRLIEREKITGVLPPALALRQEDAELEEVLDREVTQEGVRRVVQDFNNRVVEARRQLLGGPPVITPTRDADAEVDAWTARRDARRAARQLEARAGEQQQSDRRGRVRWWFRRSRRRRP